MLGHRIFEQLYFIQMLRFAYIKRISRVIASLFSTHPATDQWEVQCFLRYQRKKLVETILNHLRLSKRNILHFVNNADHRWNTWCQVARRVFNRNEIPNGTENSRNFQISGKKDNLQGLSKMFETKISKIAVPF